MNDEQSPDLTKKRDPEDYYKLSRSQLFNHFDTENKKSKPDHKIMDFITKRLWSWLYYYLRSRFLPNHAYPAYVSPDTGVYTLEKNGGPEVDYISIAIVADWATDTNESIQIAQKMDDHHPDYTIHMGDTYYVGAPHEIENNFIKPGSPWVRGNTGSFGLLGNHEMYAQGIAFFDNLLPTLGIKNKGTGIYEGQKTGFFCLENDHWRILGLDTGYHSIGKIPVVELIFPPDCHFDPILMQWLEDTVHLNDPADKKGILIITHHQYITAFKTETEYMKPAAQLAQLIGKDRPVVWLWGHEHKFSTFEKAQVGDGITAYGRCIGHGGMPVELNSKSFQINENTKGASKLVMVDTRPKPGTEKYPLGYNGYAIIKIQGSALSIEYYDTRNLLLTERWTVDLNGVITGTAFPDPDFKVTTKDNKPWSRMVG
ncbi:MAG TPA: metallophosphoesterase [Puia sp.]